MATKQNPRTKKKVSQDVEKATKVVPKSQKPEKESINEELKISLEKTKESIAQIERNTQNVVGNLEDKFCSQMAKLQETMNSLLQQRVFEEIPETSSSIRDEETEVFNKGPAMVKISGNFPLP